MTAPQPYPVFLKLAGERVVVVGAGPVAAGKLNGLVEAGARVTVIAPAVVLEIAARGDVTVERREFRAEDLDGARFVVAAATPEVNREVAIAAAARNLFVNAVDDVASATAYLGGVVRRGEVTVAVSTGGSAPALAGLLREALDAILPHDLDAWVDLGRRLRAEWKRDRIAMARRRPMLLERLVELYGGPGR